MKLYEALKIMSKEDFEETVGRLVWAHTDAACHAMLEGMKAAIDGMSFGAKDMYSEATCIGFIKDALNREVEE